MLGYSIVKVPKRWYSGDKKGKRTVKSVTLSITKYDYNLLKRYGSKRTGPNYIDFSF